MLFNSFEFMIFLPVVCLLYYLMPHRFRWAWLLAASCYFYMAFVPVYILILGFTIVVDYFAGILIENAAGKKRKLYLCASLIANVSVLAVFKYYNFLVENVTLLAHTAGLRPSIPYLNILLPIGLSFHTFQAMSYTIEVYRGNQAAERHFGIYALYVLFFPQLVAGPIERPQNILHQFYERHRLVFHDITEGGKYILWGFFMKLVVADRLALYVTTTYNHAEAHSGNTLLLAAAFFVVQIYCDFAGYSSIAIGSARLLGFRLMKNFDRPLFATSISSFWRKWHISLSSWFADYIYKPMGGSQLSLVRTFMNIMIVFLISGLWHGADWNFVAFGGVMGLLVALERVLLPWRKRLGAITGGHPLYRAFCFLLTISTVILVFVLFRGDGLSGSLFILKKIFTDRGGLFIPSPSQMTFSLLGIAILFANDIFGEYSKNIHPYFNNRHVLLRYFSYAVLVILILMIGVFDGGQFIYFQF